MWYVYVYNMKITMFVKFFICADVEGMCLYKENTCSGTHWYGIHILLRMFCPYIEPCM